MYFTFFITIPIYFAVPVHYFQDNKIIHVTMFRRVFTSVGFDCLFENLLQVTELFYLNWWRSYKNTLKIIPFSCAPGLVLIDALTTFIAEGKITNKLIPDDVVIRHYVKIGQIQQLCPSSAEASTIKSPPLRRRGCTNSGYATEPGQPPYLPHHADTDWPVAPSAGCGLLSVLCTLLLLHLTGPSPDPELPCPEDEWRS